MADMTIRPFNPDTPNSKVFNAIRNEATDDFRRRVPAATQADIQESLRALNQYPGGWNEFISALVNKVGLTIAKNRNWTNPLAKFKRGMLEYGESIEEIQTGLVQAYVYDHDQDYGERALFGRERPEVQADYHHINRENFYKITVDSVALKRAFLSPSGLASFINNLMDAPTTSDNWDEYLVMRQLFAEYEANGGFFKVHVPEIPTDAEASVEARQALRAIRTYIGKLPFLSRHYNVAHMPVHAESAELELFVTPEFQAALDVEALAGLFNVSYAEVSSRITVIDQFPEGMDDIRAILTTRDFFVVADTYYETTNQPNAVGLHENFFLHHHQIVSASRFVPAIAFTVGEGTQIIVPETPVTAIGDVEVHDVGGNVITTVQRGSSYEVTGKAVTTPEGGVNDAIRFELVGAESTRTYITQTAVLHVAADETSNSITVHVTSVDDQAFTKDVVLSVVGDRLVLWPNPEVVPDEDNDGLVEVVPVEPGFDDPTITIPSVTGVQYTVGGTNVNNGTTHTADGTPGTTVTAVARTGYEIKTGATASWVFVAE